MQQDKVASMIGLATKAGKVVSGAFSVEKAVKAGKAYLVIIADDSSANTKKMFKNMCEYYNVQIYFYSNKSSLGHCMGKEDRSSVAITDKGFGITIEKQLNNYEKALIQEVDECQK